MSMRGCPPIWIFFWTIDLFKSSNLDSAQVIWQNIHLPCNMSCFQTNNVIYCSIPKIPRLKTKTWRFGPPCVLIYCTIVVLSHLIKTVLFWTRSIKIAHSFGFTRFRTLLKVNILKCCFLRYWLRGFKFMISLKFPPFLGTRKRVM